MSKTADLIAEYEEYVEQAAWTEEGATMLFDEWHAKRLWTSAIENKQTELSFEEWQKVWDPTLWTYYLQSIFVEGGGLYENFVEHNEQMAADGPHGRIS